MPEGDSIYQLSKRLQGLVGRRIIKSDIRVPRYALTDLSGAEINAIWPYGKHLYIQCGELIIHSHLQMDGFWDLHKRGEAWRQPARFVRIILHISTTPGESDPIPWELVGYRIRQLRVFPARHYYDAIAHLGPDILAPDWTEGGREEAWHRILEHPEAPIGGVLLDQRIVAGIGNEYRAEVCFIAGIHPARRVDELAPDQVLEVLDIARGLMIENRDAPLRVTTGIRRAGESTYVYGRQGRPCRRCREEIRCGDLSYSSGTEPQDRLIWWCPRCQEL